MNIETLKTQLKKAKYKSYIKKYDLKQFGDISIIDINDEICYEVDWDEEIVKLFCQLFGVSAYKTGYPYLHIITNLDQPFNPQIKF